MSPILGGMFVLDPLGTVLTNLAGTLLGLPFKDIFLITGAGIVLMIPGSGSAPRTGPSWAMSWP